MFAYKHTKTVEYIKNSSLLFKKNTKSNKKKLLGLRMQSFQSIIFIWIRIYREIFNFALVYL